MQLSARMLVGLGTMATAVCCQSAYARSAASGAQDGEKSTDVAPASPADFALHLPVLTPSSAAVLRAPGPAPTDLIASDEALPPRFNLAQALVIFDKRGFDKLVAEANVQAAQGDVRTAGAIINPQITGSIGHTGGHYHPSNCGGTGCSATAYNLSVSDQSALSDVLTNKRGLRREVAVAALEAAKMGRDDAARSLRLLLKSQYLAVAVDAANLRFLDDVQQSYANTYALFATRYRAGDISEADLVRMETAALEAEQNVDAAQEQVRIDKVSLAFLLGVRSRTPEFDVEDGWLEQVGSKQLIEVPEAHWLDVARERRPDLKAQGMQRQRAQAAVRLSQRGRVPDVALNFSFQQEGDGETAIQPPTYNGGLTLVLPVFYQAQGEIKRARADAVTQDILYKKLEAQLVSDVAQAYASMTAGHRRLVRMQSKLRARAARGLDLIQLQYEKGAASLLDLLDAQRVFTAINQEYIGDLNAFWLALFELEGAVAMELQP